MRSVSEHQQLVAELVPRAAVGAVPLRAAVGRALAGDVLATVALPSFDNSAMDGYAVRAADVGDATDSTPVTLPVAADIPAGRTEILELRAGTAHRIMTGAPMPLGADAVVPVEATDGGVESVVIRETATAGRHIRRIGEDVRIGDRVLRDGVRVGPAQVGLLAAIGVSVVNVYSPLHVLVLSTGTELVEAGRELQHGQIYESNGQMLAVAIEDAGASATLLQFVADDVDAFHAALEPHLAGVDLIITTGGVSAGAYEVVKDALDGEQVTFTRVAMQPGMPQGCGVYRGTPIVTFPGNPISALVSFEVFLRPALRAAMGYRDAQRPVVSARLCESTTSPAGRRQFRRGSYDPTTAQVTLVGPPGSHFLRSLAEADSLVDIGEDVTELAVGDAVRVWDLH